MAFLKDAAKKLANDVKEDALNKLSEGLSGGGGLMFPDDLGSNKIVFQIKTRERETTSTPTVTKNGATIALPIPTSLSTGYGAQYAQVGLGPLGQAARDFVEGGVSAQSLKDRAASGQVSDVITEQAKVILASAGIEAAGLAGGLLGGVGGAAVGTAAVGAAQGALAGAAIAVNPHLAVLFEGVGFRNHSFNYKFSPRNSGESSAIKDIIFEFKNAMHPSKEGLAFFNYPDEFDISFPNNEKFLFKIGTSVLTDFQINYNPDGGSFFHVNGAPVSVSMSMSFTELDVLTKSEIGDGR